MRFPVAGPKPREFERFALGALAGASMASVLVIMTVTPLGLPLKIGIVCFSLSIPVLSTFLLMDVFYRSYGMAKIPDYGGPLISLAAILALAGIACVFFHIWLVAGVLYTVSFLFAWWVIGRHMDTSSTWGYDPHEADEDSTESNAAGERNRAERIVGREPR